MHCARVADQGRASHEPGLYPAIHVFKVRGLDPHGRHDKRSMPDIKSLTAAELLRLYRKRELSPVEVTRDQLDRIEKFEPAINAFIIVDRDGALKAAQGLRGALAARASRSASPTASARP